MVAGIVRRGPDQELLVQVRERACLPNCAAAMRCASQIVAGLSGP